MRRNTQTIRTVGLVFGVAVAAMGGHKQVQVVVSSSCAEVEVEGIRAYEHK